MELLNEFIESIFIGFGIFILTTSFFSFKNEKRNEGIIDLTDSATFITRLAAIGYLVNGLLDLYAMYLTQEYDVFMDRLTGPFWFGYWIYLICYGIFPQLLWVRRIREVKAMRVVTAILFLFVLYIEKLVILITSLHRDYILSSWTTVSGYSSLYDWFVDLIVFGVVLGLVHLVKLRVTKNA